jgi:biotin carboxyl carrier protein
MSSMHAVSSPDQKNTMEPKVYEALVDGHLKLPFPVDELETLDIRPAGPGRWHFIHEGKSYHVDVEIDDYADKRFVLKIDGFRHTVKLSDPYDVLVQQLGLAKKAVHQTNLIKAPMPGLIREVLVSPGQEVVAGEAILILEAMKMENIIKSPGAGRVASINALPGAPVEKGQILIVFEE